jgi:hypothetical protein
LSIIQNPTIAGATKISCSKIYGGAEKRTLELFVGQVAALVAARTTMPLRAA